MSFVCQSYVLVFHSDVICMSLVCTRISSVCHWYVIVCHSYVLACHSYVTRTYSYVIPMSLVYGFTMKLINIFLCDKDIGTAIYVLCHTTGQIQGSCSVATWEDISHLHCLDYLCFLKLCAYVMISAFFASSLLSSLVSCCIMTSKELLLEQCSESDNDTEGLEDEGGLFAF